MCCASRVVICGMLRIICASFDHEGVLSCALSVFVTCHTAFVGPHIKVALSKQHNWHQTTRTWGGPIADSGFNKSAVVNVFKDAADFAQQVIYARYTAKGLPDDHPNMTEPNLISTAVRASLTHM
jgi:hypothetical protein